MKCLAKNTIGDGTGCDNMTAVIVQFKPKLLDDFDEKLPEETTINEKTDENNRKRVASPIMPDGGDDNVKKIKTDADEDQQAVASLEAEAKNIDVTVSTNR